jgi:hypothetical protein
MDTQVGLVAHAPVGRVIEWVSLTVFSTVAVRAAVMVKSKVSNLVEPTGKCWDIIVYMFIEILPLVSPC